MTEPSPRPTRPTAPGLATVVVVAAGLASGCSERESAAPGIGSRAAAPTSKELYLDYCASCHGADGRGDGPLAAELRVAPINLRVLKHNNDGDFPMTRVQRSIDGRAMPRAHGLPDMPVWGRQWLKEGLRDAEVQARAIAISSYIASIQD